MIKFKFTLASGATGKEFHRVVEADTFPLAVKEIKRLAPGCESQRELYNNGEGWKDVPRWANEQKSAGLL